MSYSGNLFKLTRVEIDSMFWVQLTYVGPQPTTELEALEINLAKWNTITREREAGNYVYSDGGKETCGLCLLYYTVQDECAACPITRHTHYPLCQNTMWTQFARAKRSINLELMLRSAREMATLLESLLTGQTKHKSEAEQMAEIILPEF